MRKNTYIAGHSSGMRISLSSSIIVKPYEPDINVKLKEQSDCLGVSNFHQANLLLIIIKLIQTFNSLWIPLYSISGPVAMFLCQEMATSVLTNALFFKVLISEISVMSSSHKASPVTEPDTLFIEKGTFNTSASSEMARINTVFNSLTQ